MSGLRAALAFLTILPVGTGGDGAGRSLQSARAWFPVVGLLLGTLLAAFDLLLGAASLRPPADSCAACMALPLLTAALLVSALAVLTRALHLDGFMDTCDALPGGFTRARRLQILRDPHVGAFAVVGVVCLLLIKVTAVAAMPAASRSFVLVLFPCLSRWAMLLAMQLGPYVRDTGAGTPFAGGHGRGALIGGSGVAVVAGLALAGWSVLPLLALAGGAAVAMGLTARRLLGGMTGDIYGAVNEIAEAVVLIAAVWLPFAGWLE
jgi:adenosylcobinamide-GDP ribazoletransferase